MTHTFYCSEGSSEAVHSAQEGLPSSMLAKTNIWK